MNDFIEYKKTFENKYGIDLIVLLKALENGAYSLCHDSSGYPQEEEDGLYFWNYLQLDLSTSCLYSEWRSDYNVTGRDCLFFKDYGKTWALTKEELL